jgi:hypothetical protein
MHASIHRCVVPTHRPSIDQHSGSLATPPTDANERRWRVPAPKLTSTQRAYSQERASPPTESFAWPPADGVEAYAHEPYRLGDQSWSKLSRSPVRGVVGCAGFIARGIPAGIRLEKKCTSLRVQRSSRVVTNHDINLGLLDAKPKSKNWAEGTETAG